MVRPRHARLIIHAKAADNEALAAAVEALRGEGHRLEQRITQAAGDAEQLAEEAAREEVDTVIAVGGDGTLHEVVNGLWRAGIPGRSASTPQVGPALGVVPLGTANDFAAGCGLPAGDPVAALRLAVEGEPVPIDLVRMADRVFVNVASGGFVTEVTAATPPEAKELLGRLAYLVTGLKSVFEIVVRPVRLTGPDFSWEGGAYVLAVGNGRLAGGGFRLCDRAALDDGLLDLLVLPDVPFDDFLGLLGDLLAGSSRDYVQALYRQMAWLEVEAPEGIRFNLDGEPLCGSAFRFEVVPQALRVHLPPRQP